jgi:hypothetical protein
LAQIAQKFEHFLDIFRCPDGSRWGGRDLHKATGGVVTRSCLTSLRDPDGYRIEFIERD